MLKKTALFLHDGFPKGYRAQMIVKSFSFQAVNCFDKVSAGLLETNDIDEANMENKFCSLPNTGKWITISIKYRAHVAHAAQYHNIDHYFSFHNISPKTIQCFNRQEANSQLVFQSIF